MAFKPRPFAPKKATVRFALSRRAIVGKKIPERELKKHGEYRYKRSSDLYRYLADNMVGLRAQGYGTRNGPPWIKLVERATKDGFTRVSGQPLTIEAVRKVFARADTTLAAEERMRRTGVVAKAAPNRAPQGWRPPVVEKQPSPQLRSSPFAPTRPTPENSASDDISPDELMAGIRGVIEKRSGR